MMLFGKKDSFAVQVELDQDYMGAWLFGRACYWICGDQVGDYDLGASLRDVLFLWERISCDAGKRGSDFLKSLPTEELGHTLQRSMYGHDDHDETLAQRARDEQWARHEIGPSINIFNTFVWLVEEGEGGRCVYQTSASSDASPYKECSLRAESFDETLKAAIGFLLQHYDAAVAASAAE